MEEQNSIQLAEHVKSINSKFDILKTEIAKVIVGNESIVTLSCIGMLTNGHILLEGVPGVAKTTLIKTISQALGLTFSRVQFTPDLLPADIVGTLIYNPKTLDFDTKKGPLFANLVLADEINRSPAKVQSALLEAMQERQVTIGSTTYTLDDPFLVFATQNPIENEGTYQLPEAQVDRFMFKIPVSYPTLEQERVIVSRLTKPAQVHTVLMKKDLVEARELVENIHIEERLVQYVLDIVFATREPQRYGLKNVASYVTYGASPRATIALVKASKAYAFLQGRHFVIPDDIKRIAQSVLRHRILLSYHAVAEDVTVDQVVQTILEAVPVP